MQTEVTLTFKDEPGHTRRVVIRTERFTIGRSPESNLTINNPNLSRHHALIENVHDCMHISDCGSRNGTMVNSRLVTSAVELHDGDVITLGGACDIAVALRRETAASISSWLDPPVIAGAAAVLILLVAGALLIASMRNDSENSAADNNVSGSWSIKVTTVLWKREAQFINAAA